MRDAEEWVRLKNTVWRTAYCHIMPIEVFDEQDHNFPNKVAQFRERRLNENGHIGYVVEDEGRIVALADATRVSFYEYYKGLGYADLGAMYMLPEYQRQGLGKILFDRIVDEFKSMGATTMVIGVLKDNTRARQAYEKWGGVLDSHKEKFKKLDREYDEVFYIFDLREL